MKLDLYSGSRLKMNSAMWPAYYEARLRLGGSRATIAPIGDPLHANAARTTFTSVGEEQVVWTPTNSGLHLWATPLDLRQDSSWKGIIPCIQFDGSTDWIETPDAAFWTGTADGTAPNEPSFTWIMWAEVVAGASGQALWTKTPAFSAAGGGEWGLQLTNTERLQPFAFDDSAGAQFNTFTGVLTATWHQLVVTKSTTADATSFLCYIDGALVSDTDGSDGAYTAMENGTTVVRIGAESDGGSPLSSALAGGPLGPLFIPGTVMSADAILRDRQLGRRALAL